MDLHERLRAPLRIIHLLMTEGKKAIMNIIK